jgi:hypothetical protein
MKYTQIFALCASAALAAALLVGCGSSAASSESASSEAVSSEAASSTSDTASVADGSVAVDAIFAGVLAANPISNQFEIADMNIEYDFMLAKDDIVAYKGVKSNDNGDAGLVLVLEVADGKAQSVADTLSTYRDDQVAFYGNYAEFAQAQDNVKNSMICTGGNYVVMAIASNECTDTAALAAAANAAL